MKEWLQGLARQERLHIMQWRIQGGGGGRGACPPYFWLVKTQRDKISYLLAAVAHYTLHFTVGLWYSAPLPPPSGSASESGRPMHTCTETTDYT